MHIEGLAEMIDKMFPAGSRRKMLPHWQHSARSGLSGTMSAPIDHKKMKRKRKIAQASRRRNMRDS